MLFQDYSEDLIILALSDNDDKYMLMRWGKKNAKKDSSIQRGYSVDPWKRKAIMWYIWLPSTLLYYLE